MQADAQEVTKYMTKEYQNQLFGKVRTALVFSVLSIIMENVNGVYMRADIIMVALTVNFVCAVLHNVVFASIETRRLFHAGFILRSISRQSVLVVSSAIADSVHIWKISEHNMKIPSCLSFQRQRLLASLHASHHGFYMMHNKAL